MSQNETAATTPQMGSLIKVYVVGPDYPKWVFSDVLYLPVAPRVGDHLSARYFIRRIAAKRGFPSDESARAIIEKAYKEDADMPVLRVSWNYGGNAEELMMLDDDLPTPEDYEAFVEIVLGEPVSDLWDTVANSSEVRAKDGPSRVPVSTKGLVRTTEAQRLFGLGSAKFWQWVEDGHFPVFRPDGDKSRIAYVRMEDVEQFITTGKSVSVPNHTGV